ncbi:BTAD domain-containing putative transcriptional regulator [Roseisolibacter agri]|uniref:Bacterial transcriptional activator domain-containing protein n=1 Tax=Roseisolibacter agri TaxID=2014610 RepID=A0AA37V1I0_9BACT|nr:BTAD domain-containing putative transcriptional regulator [Roseisolibacter agri]GLC23817.1 hypothetical protein rosag_03300 [Roseisolibacter agri]
MVVPHNIPAALTSLIGRDREIDDVRQLLAETRYLTLTGVGGAGKTRLAREVAALAAGIGRDDGAAPYAGGVWWVELAPLAPGADVAPAAAVALGVNAPAGDALTGAIAEAIGTRRTLLVLDNCEHVVEGCAALADALLRACPALTVVATSREALGGDGETVWQLPRLSHPPLAPEDQRSGGRVEGSDPAALADYASVRLFVSRARAASPRFALTAQNAAAVRAICARLDGLPLALELAAANVGVLGVEQIAVRLDDAFAVLTRGRRTALPRHRTLGALLDWSYDLLAPEERRLLARLSVFRAAVPLEAIEVVGSDDRVGDVLGAFSGLVDHSLVDVAESEGEPRYRLLETVRQYAAARLRATPDDEAATRRRHARWMAALADVMGEETGSPRRGRAMARFHPRLEDARAALDWSTGPGGDPVDALRIAGGLAIFWHWAGLWAEGRQWAEAAVRGADAAATARGESDDASRPLDERVALAKALQTALLLAWMLGNPAATVAHAARALPLWRTVAGDPAADAAARARAAQWEAYTHEILAFARLALGDVAEAERAVEAAVAAAERSGSGWARGLALGWRAMLATAVGRPADATRDLERAEAELRAVGDTWVLSWCHANGATAALAQGDPAAAARQARAGVAALQAEPDWHYVSRALDALAEAGAAWLASPAGAAHPAAERDALAGAAATLLGAAAGVRERSGTAVWPFDHEAHATAVAAVRAALAPDAFAARWAEGHATPLDAVFALASEARVVPDETSGATPHVASHATPIAAPSDGDERATTSLRIRVLGPFLVQRDGVEVPLEAWRSAKARELLLHLVLHGARSREQIGLALWPDASDAQVRNAFHVTLHALRRALGGREWVVFDGSAYALRRDGDVAVDVDALLDAAAGARRAVRRQDAPDESTLGAWRATLEEARGELGEGVPSGDWLVEHQDRVRAAHADGLSALGQLYAARGAHRDAAAAYRALVARDPLQEAAHRALMRAYAAAGEPARAVRHYEELTALLRRELGAAPARETAALAAELRGAI